MRERDREREGERERERDRERERERGRGRGIDRDILRERVYMTVAPPSERLHDNVSACTETNPILFISDIIVRINIIRAI